MNRNLAIARRDFLRTGVHLTGGYSVCPEVREFAEWILGIPAQIGRVKGISGPASHLENTRYSSALGLAKRSHVCAQNS
jgi:cell division ATPase FtsA